MNGFFRLALALVALACLSLSGCATIVKGSTQDLNITTDPSGASCDLSRGGTIIASVNPTPGQVQIKKDKSDIEVTCKKNGYAEAGGRIPSSFEGWSVGNILFGGIIGIAVDYNSGAMNSYEPELFVKLTPDKFATVQDKEDFYEKWRNDVLQNSAKAKIAAAKTCVKEQCDEMSSRIDKETEQALAGIEANRNLQPKPQTPAGSSAQSQAAGPVAPGATQSTAAVSAGNDMTAGPRAGDRWKYRLMDGKKAAGVVAVEIIESRGKTVRERVTYDTEKSFVADRAVDGTFNPSRFQDAVILPGGFQIEEIAPYLVANQGLKVGQQWPDIPGTFQFVQVGKKNILMQVKVVRQEKVRVPAGDFDATLIEATGTEYFVQFNVKVTSRFWYSPQMMRSVKTSLQIVYSIPTNNSNPESYELVAFEPAK